MRSSLEDSTMTLVSIVRFMRIRQIWKFVR